MGCTSGFQEITEESLTADALVLTFFFGNATYVMRMQLTGDVSISA